MIGAVICVPLDESVPLQPPEALQDAALVELQVSDAVPPRATAAGDAVSVAVGKGFTVTAAVTGTLVPPGPEHVSEYVALSSSAPVLWEPLVARVPLQAPMALHETARVEVHVSVADSPASIVAGDAASETVGTGVGVIAPPPHADNNIASPIV